MSDAGYGESEYGQSHYGDTTTNTHFPERWIERTRSLLEIPQGHETWRFFTAWARAEGGNARWNPLNTTISIRGTVDWDESDYNSTGVKNYKYAIVGIIAIALTFTQRKADGSLVYGILLSNLRHSGLTAEQIVNSSRADIHLWGTNPDLMLQILQSL